MIADFIGTGITVATLTARGEFSRLRRLLGAVSPEATAELDRLTDLLTDALTLDDVVSSADYEALEEARKDDAAEIEKLEKEAEAAEEKIGEYRQAAEGSLEAVRGGLAVALDERAKMAVEVERMKSRVADVEAAIDGYRRASARDSAEAAKMATRTAAWSEDKTAAQTADHYREKYEKESERLQTLSKKLDMALAKASTLKRTSTVREKTAREVVAGIRRETT